MLCPLCFPPSPGNTQQAHARSLRSTLPLCRACPLFCLQTFKVDLINTQQIMESAAGQEVLQRGLIMAGESGIFTPADVAFVQSGEWEECYMQHLGVWCWCIVAEESGIFTPADVAFVQSGE